MTIGERIKTLRKKNDMTQEKLADFLHVSYQAVSKWECGIANPDLSLIVPLTRLFNVSADELLGLKNEEVDERKAYFDAEYFDFWMKDDSEADRKEYTAKCAGTVAHETAHEWFYAAVGNDQYHEAWLDESLAAFSEQVYWRHVGRSEEEVAAVMKPFVENMPESGNATINHVYHERLTENSHFDYTSAVYQRGAGFIYQLEQSMGKEDFYTFMREYYETYCLGEAHTEDFISVLQPYISENAKAQALVEKYLDCAPIE